MPVELPVLLAFVLAVLALVMSPGPDTMVIMRSALVAGVPAGMAAVAGVQAGFVVHTAAAVLGISLIIASSPWLFSATAIAGPVISAGWASRVCAAAACCTSGALDQRPTMRQAFRDAALCNLLNPKVIVLFLALLPNFVERERGAVGAQLVTLGITLILVNTVWQAPIAWAAGAVRRRLIRPAVQRAIARVSGAILLVFAVLLLVQHFV